MKGRVELMVFILWSMDGLLMANIFEAKQLFELVREILDTHAQISGKFFLSFVYILVPVIHLFSCPVGYCSNNLVEGHNKLIKSACLVVKQVLFDSCTFS
jgi:hypothetical protein